MSDLYQTTVLGRSPALYYRLDMVGAASNGDSVPDLSVNNLDASVVFLNSAIQPYGYASAIETDSASRAFYGNNDTTGAFPRAAILRATDALIEPAGDFWLEGWLYLPSGLAAASHSPQMYFGKGSGNPILPITNSFYIGTDVLTERFVGGMYDNAGTLFTVTDSTTLIAYDTWYYVALVRSGNTLALYTNGVLRSTAPITSGLPTNVAGDFFIHTPQTAPLYALYDEIAMGTTSESSGPILATYEAAFETTFLTGFSNVIPTAVLRSTEEPDPITFPLRHNWDSALVERISFLTNVSTSATGMEEGLAIRPTPRREIEIAQVMRDDYERRQLRAALWTGQRRKWYVPVLEDRERLTAPLVSASTISLDTRYKNYEAGGYVHVRQLDATGRITKSENVGLLSLTDDQLTLDATLSNDYTSPEVCPAWLAYLQPGSQSIKGHTDAVEEVSLVFRLLAENEPITPRRLIPWTPSLKYRDYEVFDLAQWRSNDWSDSRDYEVSEETVNIDFDSGVFNFDGDRAGAIETVSYRFATDARADSAAFLGWFYERMGQLRYFWLPSVQRDFEVLGAAGAVLTVDGTNYATYFNLTSQRRDLAFIYNDNSMEFRRVVGVVADVNSEQLTLDGAVPSLTNLRSVSLLRFGRLAADQLEIAKETDTVWRFAFTFVELAESPAGTGLSSLSPSASISHTRSPSSSASPSGSGSVSVSPSGSTSPSTSVSPSHSASPSGSISPSSSKSATPSASVSPSASRSPSLSQSPSPSKSVSPSSSTSPS
jgi:hypothetical protein